MSGVEVVAPREGVRLKPWEFHALVAEVFLLIAALAAAAGRFVAMTPIGFGIGFFCIFLVLLPLQSVFARHYYGRAISVPRMLVMAVVASAIGATVASLIGRL